MFAVCTGMINDVGYEEQQLDSEAYSRRLKSLSNFQAMLLRHSLKFPSVRRVVYSTCSIFEQENELVIQDVLQSGSSAFQLVDVLPMLPSRGQSSTLLQAKSCVRLSPESSLTEGFFIACLERVEVPSYPLSTGRLQVGQSDAASVASSLSCGEIQSKMKNAAATDGRKLHRHKKSKKEKAARFERSEVYNTTVVEEKSRSKLDEQSSKGLNGTMSFIPEPTSAMLETKRDIIEKKRKSHKHKKSKNEKAAKVPKLEHSEIDIRGLDHATNSLDTVITHVLTSNQAASDTRKLHKSKKSKKDKTIKIKQLETTGIDEQQSEIKPGRPSVKSLCENALSIGESTKSVVQTEYDTVGESGKSHKHKKSKTAASVEKVVQS